MRVQVTCIRTRGFLVELTWYLYLPNKYISLPVPAGSNPRVHGLPTGTRLTRGYPSSAGITDTGNPKPAGIKGTGNPKPAGFDYLQDMVLHSYYCKSSSFFAHRKRFKQMFSIISSSGIRPEMVDQEDSTVAAQVVSSDKECRKWDTVSLPLENA